MDVTPGLDPVPATTAHLVPREEQYPELLQQFASVHQLEVVRRRNQGLATLGGWGLAAVFATYALIAGLQNINHPAPRDRFEIAFVHDDGSYDAPRDENEMTPVQQREVLLASLVNYVTYREGYSFAASQKSYDIVSAMTGGHDQSRYQQVMLDRSLPENPVAKYGMRGQLTATDIRFDVDPSGPNSWNFSFVRTLSQGDITTTSMPMRGSLTFVRGPVPRKYRVPFDPASIVVLQYESHEVLPTKPGAAQ